MSFRLVPNSVSFDDLERRNSPSGRVISPNSVALGADYLKVVEDPPILLQRKCRPKNLVLAIYHLWQYWQGITSSESVKGRRPVLASENLTNNQP